MKIGRLSVSFLIIIYIILSCKNENKVDPNSRFNNFKTLNIQGNPNNQLQIDSLFSEIMVIQLETKPECLISNIEKLLIHNNRLYIQDRIGRILVFNMDGKFLLEVGKTGKGPGEYLKLLDFEIDKNEEIYVLDFMKIHRFSSNGNYLEYIPLNFLSRSDNIYSNPVEFTLGKNGNFYIWGGSVGIRGKPEFDVYAFYEVSKKGKIINKYLPISYQVPSGLQKHRFPRYNDTVLVDPIFGSNVVYYINYNNLVPKYKIDFGEKTFNIPIPEGFNSHADFTLNIDQLYYHTIEGFIETKDWIYFRFLYKMYYHNVFYSKKLLRSFISKVYPYVEGRFAPDLIYGEYNGCLISFMEPFFALELIEKCNKLNLTSLSSYEKRIIQKLERLKISDNPVVIVCSMKRY